MPLLSEKTNEAGNVFSNERMISMRETIGNPKIKDNFWRTSKDMVLSVSLILISANKIISGAMSCGLETLKL